MIGPITRLVAIYMFCWCPLASAFGWNVSALMLAMAAVVVAFVAFASIAAYLYRPDDYDLWADFEDDDTAEAIR